VTAIVAAVPTGRSRVHLALVARLALALAGVGMAAPVSGEASITAGNVAEPAAAAAPSTAAVAAEPDATDEAARTAPAGTDEIVVTGQRARRLELDFDATESVNRIELEGLRRIQASDVFETVRDMPGVSVEGGPRTSGKSFSIRGFSSNEDVLVQIDGVTQNFEKYRYGSGVDIEPELLKAVTVYRGGAATAQSAGYIGGAVRMETKSASDFLEDDQRYGSQAKVGYLTNNDGQLYSLTGYGAPLGFADALFNVTKRHTNDYALPDGSRFPDSAEGQLSGLGKVTLQQDDLRFQAVQRYSEDSGREPFDITGGISGIGGDVLRSSTEQSTAFNSTWDPASDLVAAEAALGFIAKSVIDEGSAIAGVDVDGNAIGRDDFTYQIWTVNAANTATFELLGTRHLLSAGVQANRERRFAERTNLNGVGPNPAQPSGEKRFHALHADQRVEWGLLSAEAGLRHDWYRVAPGQDGRALLRARGLDESIRFDRSSPHYGVGLRLGPADIFYRWSRTFRAPLLDEYFARGSFSSCFEFTHFTPAPVQPSLELPAPPLAPDIGDFADVFDFLAALDLYNNVLLPAYLAALNTALTDFNAALIAFQTAQLAYLDDPLAQPNAFCGDLYKPETAVSREAGFTLAFDALWYADDHLDLKFTYYDMRVRDLLESIFENARTGEISQPGREVRKGFEVELHYAAGERWFADFTLGTLDGYFQYNFFADNVDESVAALGNPGTTPLFNQPADALSIILGIRPLADLELGHRLRAVAARTVTVGVVDNCPGGLFTNPVCNILGEQAGYITSNFFAAWQPRPGLDLRLTVDNALNKEYALAGFGGALGATAPGRDVRLTLSYRY